MLKLIVGPMGSGKSAEALEFVNECKNKNIPVICFKPKIDTRTVNTIKSRNGMEHKAVVVESLSNMFDLITKFYNKGITNFVCDEIQFIKVETIGEMETIKQLVRFVDYNKINLVCSGLNQTSEMGPFLSTAIFTMYADKVTVKTGICEYCGGKSKRTVCTQEKSEQILVGDDIYEQTCYGCGSVVY